MKKIIALVTLALGVMLGVSGTAHAYPPDAPQISGPYTEAPGASVAVTVSNVVPFIGVTFEFQGETITLVADENGTATATFTAPAQPGTYPVTVTLTTGEVLSTTITVATGGGGTDGNGTTGGDNGATGDTGSGLPNTGGAVLPTAGLGLAALCGGLGLLYVSKRRRSAA